VDSASGDDDNPCDRRGEYRREDGDRDAGESLATFTVDPFAIDRPDESAEPGDGMDRGWRFANCEVEHERERDDREYRQRHRDTSIGIR